ncbi:LysR family transcriptional regulator [Paraburkholderia sp. ZP32-5]|uniref:LysR family transcriptional regulator n=1 Tax=Paraburkholderia sp. ZP32-5 TaxID=2883245 RepID=UPI001F34E869|nr:LysR family transcriptional regulator [Paraburkholderia sp. ZP32-5]
MDRFEAMSMLVTVSDAGSLTAASRALKVPLTTLSRKISDLEALLGTKLLMRTTRKLTLTDAGVTYVEAARRILEQVEDAEREVTGELTAPKGDLVITAPILFGRLHVLPVIADFLALFPEINVRLVMTDRNIDLLDAHIDMAVRIGKLPDSSMVATQVGLLRTVVCASPSLVARYGVPQMPDDLLTLPCVTFDTPLPSPGWRFKAPGSTTTFELPVVPRLSVTTAEAAAQAAIRGVGATRLLHYQVFDALEAGALRIVLAEFEPEMAPVHLVHASRGQMPLKMRRFLDFAAPRLREMLVKVGACAGRP